MRIRFIKRIWKLMVMWVLLFTIIFAFSSCTCGGKGDSDINDDTDDDNTDNDNTDDDDVEGWHIYTIDSVGNFASIAIDSDNKVHIGYSTGLSPNRDLMYATNKPGTWELVNVDCEETGQVGYYVNLALDPTGKVHISYYDPYTKLKYATNKSGSWQIFVVKDGLTSGEDGDNDIGVDSNDKVHIVFFHCGGLNEDGECKVGDLKYATNKTGTWQISTIDDPGDEVEAGRWYLSMAIDSNDKLHVSYYKCSSCTMMGGTAELWYATNASGSWQRTEVGSDLFGDFFGGYNSIAVDSNGKVHISFYDKNKNLSYATNITGTWQTFTVDSGEKVGLYNSIATDSNGYAHISYCDWENKDLKYATNKTGEWQTFIIDSGEKAGLYPSIAVDADNYVHISYASMSGIRYATNRPPEE